MSLINGIRAINDVTTTLDAAPSFIYLKGRKPPEYPESFKTTQLKLYPDLQPLQTSIAAKDLFSKVVHLAKAQTRWHISSVDPLAFRLELIATTKLLRFKDDVVIEVRPEGSGASVHMRSRSHLGRNDFGANAHRIRYFLSELKKLI